MSRLQLCAPVPDVPNNGTLNIFSRPAGQSAAPAEVYVLVAHKIPGIEGPSVSRDFVEHSMSVPCGARRDAEDLSCCLRLVEILIPVPILDPSAMGNDHAGRVDPRGIVGTDDT